jgi:hypothetical protein
MGKEPLLPPGVNSGVDVLRGVTVGLRGGVGEGVQVGNIKLRGVGLGVTGVGGSGVGDGVGVELAQLASNMVMLRMRNLIPFMPRLLSVSGSFLHFFPIRQVVL